MWYRPKPFARSMGGVSAASSQGYSAPQGYRSPSFPPRAAYSHSASVGRRPPDHVQNAAASSQLRLWAGRSFQPGRVYSNPWGVERPVPSSDPLYASAVANVRPSQNPLLTFTRWRGFSKGKHSLSLGTQPISK